MAVSDKELSVIGSNNPDIVLGIEKERYCFEVKSVKSFHSSVTIFERSVARNKKPDLILEYFARLFIIQDVLMHHDMLEKGYSFDFIGIVDYIRDHHQKDVGFSEDSHTVKSGRMPKIFNTNNGHILNIVRKTVISELIEKQNSYLVLYSRASKKVNIYFTGFGKNAIGAKELPYLKKFSLATYGGSKYGATRVGIKIQFLL